MSLRRTLVIAAIALATSLTPGRAAHAQLGIDVGAAAPAPTGLVTLDGKPASLTQFLGKAPMVLEFWATWCGNCKQLEPELRRLHAKHGRQVAFVGIAVSANQKPELVRRYVQRHRLPGLQLYDAAGEATGAYDVPATSYVVVIDRAGKVVYTGVGGDQKLEAAVAKALK